MTAWERALVALGVLVVTAAAVVALVLTGHDPTVVSWLIPIVTGAWAVKEVQASTVGQNAVLGQIAENTNGKLDARIKAGVHAVLDERGHARAVIADSERPY